MISVVQDFFPYPLDHFSGACLPALYAYFFEFEGSLKAAQPMKPLVSAQKL